MSTGDWIAIGGLAVTILGGAAAWVRSIERRLGASLSREEHERICAERNARVERALDEMREDMDERHGENRETLGEIRDTMTGVHDRIDQLYRDLITRSGGH